MIDLRKHLRVDQQVALGTSSTGCHTITILAEGQQGRRIVELGNDYVVVEDSQEGVRLRLPVHCLQLTPTVAPPPPTAEAA